MNADDPKFTAYALGEELSPEDKINIEKALEESPELRAELARIRSLSGLLNDAFKEDLSASPASGDEETVVPEKSFARMLEEENSRKKRSIWPSILGIAASLGLVAVVYMVNQTEEVEMVELNPLVQVDPLEEMPPPPPPVEVAVLDMREDSTLALAEPGIEQNVDVYSQVTVAELKSRSLGEMPKPEAAMELAQTDMALRASDADALKQEMERDRKERSRIMVEPVARNWRSTGDKKDKASTSSSATFRRAVISVIAGNPSYESLSDEDSFVSPREPVGGDTYSKESDQAFRYVRDEPLSTFSVDVDTASYSNVRRFLQQKQRVPADAVRIEEMVNYFDYDYPAPESMEKPFNILTQVAPAPWNDEHRIVGVALKGYEIAWENRPASNLVFLIDVSGSMSGNDRLPLVKKGLQMLVEQLDERDRLAIVTYASGAEIVLESTPVTEKETVLGAIEGLNAQGSTHASDGLKNAYKIARKEFIKGGNNRVILCTDGDFNVGETDGKTLSEYVREKANNGIFLSVYGFGRGNLRDSRLETLSNDGNGTYGYIDSLTEARRTFVQKVTGSFLTIAKDVKIQIEFNPTNVSAYRLIGYNNRRLANKDFNDDTKDAGDVGAGHEITVFYEIVPAGVEVGGGSVDPLRYGTEEKNVPEPIEKKHSDELMTVKLRYKQPEGDKSILITTHIADGEGTLPEAGKDFQFALAVATFGEKLRGSKLIGETTWEDIRKMAQGAIGENKDGLRTEFISLIDAAEQLED